MPEHRTLPFRVATLVDAATIQTDVSLADTFRVTLQADRTLGEPQNPLDGDVKVWEVTNGDVSDHTLSLDAVFTFNTDITGLTAITAGKTDILSARYHAGLDVWRVTSYIKGC